MTHEWIAELVKYSPKNHQNRFDSDVSVVGQLDVVLLCGRGHRLTSIDSFQSLIQWSRYWCLDMENFSDVSYLSEIPFGPRLWQVPTIVQTEYKLVPVYFSSVHGRSRQVCKSCGENSQDMMHKIQCTLPWSTWLFKLFFLRQYLFCFGFGFLGFFCFCFCFFVLFFPDRVSLCSPGCRGTL